MLPNLVERHDEHQVVEKVRVKEVVDVFFYDSKLDSLIGHDPLIYTERELSYHSRKHV